MLQRVAATVLLCSAFLLAACGREAPPQETDLSGVWQSATIILDRGNFTETYQFTVTLKGNAGSIMDLAYFTTGEAQDERIIRQDITIEMDDDTVALIGSTPRLVSGPEISGVYEPDSLFCNPLARNTPDSLTCGWGSDAHGDGPRVSLTRRADDQD